MKTKRYAITDRNNETFKYFNISLEPGSKFSLRELRHKGFGPKQFIELTTKGYTVSICETYVIEDIDFEKAV